MICRSVAKHLPTNDVSSPQITHPSSTSRRDAAWLTFCCLTRPPFVSWTCDGLLSSVVVLSNLFTAFRRVASFAGRTHLTVGDREFCCELVYFFTSFALFSCLAITFVEKQWDCDLNFTALPHSTPSLRPWRFFVLHNSRTCSKSQLVPNNGYARVEPYFPCADGQHGILGSIPTH